MKSDEAVMRIQANEDVAVEGAIKFLRGYTQDICHTLVSLVASLCDIEEDELMKNKKHIYSSQARGLYWYAYRQLTGESYEVISRRASQHIRISSAGVCKAVSSMSMLIASGTIWTKRFAIIKRVIRESSLCEDKEHFSKDAVVRVVAPKGVKIEIKQEQ